MATIILPNIATIAIDPFTDRLVNLIQRMANNNIIFFTDVGTNAFNLMLHPLFPEIAPFVISIGGADTYKSFTYRFLITEIQLTQFCTKAPALRSCTCQIQ
jgi:dihydrofolate reductase